MDNSFFNSFFNIGDIVRLVNSDIPIAELPEAVAMCVHHNLTGRIIGFQSGKFKIEVGLPYKIYVDSSNIEMVIKLEDVQQLQSNQD